MTMYEQVKNNLRRDPKTWLVTGVAGFIGSNLLETLLLLGQKVVGVDNFSTGYQRNLDEVKALVSEAQWSCFQFIEGDIRSVETCIEACQGIDYVLHQAALGSVPRSIADPITTNEVNITGFLNILHASSKAEVSSFTYAASSSTYGDHPELPKVEDRIGNPLSPYAVTKYVNELYSGVFAKSYNFASIGLRYFNVFGRRQDPDGAYAAVIPKWLSAMIRNDDVFINGDGSTSRDFCFIDNVVQANVLAAIKSANSESEVYNVALNARTSLNQLFDYLRKGLLASGVVYEKSPVYREFRAGDVMHSQADISKIQSQLGYEPFVDVEVGLGKALGWYLRNLSN